MSQHELCYELHLKRDENSEKIFELLGQDVVLGIDTHDKWISWVNNVMDHINYQKHLEVMSDRSYFNEHFKPEDVKWTVHDYVYDGY